MIGQVPRWLYRNCKKKHAFAFIIFLLFGAVFFTTVNENTSTSSAVYEWPKFSLYLPHVQPTLHHVSTTQLYLAVVVNSGASSHGTYSVLRNTIRKTWGDSVTAHYRDKTWKLFFVLGMSENDTDNEMNVREALNYNDVIIGNFTDHYANLIVKTFMAHFWVTSKFPSCKYVLKTDDDVYVRVPKLLQWLKEAHSPQRFYGGYVGRDQRTVRDPKSKWFLSKDQFDEKYWPPFCHGAFHVLSTDILPQYFNYTKYRRKPFHVDDAYLGVVARDLGVMASQIPGFNLQFVVKLRSDCELLSSIAMGHKINAPTMINYHRFFTERIQNTMPSKCLAFNLKFLNSIFMLSIILLCEILM